MTDAFDGLRAWAQGSLAAQAGVELLIKSRLVNNLHAYLYDHERDADVPDGFVWPDLQAALGYGGWSGGERRLLALAANLLGQEREHEGDGWALDRLSIPNLAGLDRNNAHLAVEAVAHALGVTRG